MEARPVGALFTLEIWIRASPALLPLVESDCKDRPLFRAQRGCCGYAQMSGFAAAI